MTRYRFHLGMVLAVLAVSGTARGDLYGSALGPGGVLGAEVIRTDVTAMAPSALPGDRGAATNRSPHPCTGIAFFGDLIGPGLWEDGLCGVSARPVVPNSRVGAENQVCELPPLPGSAALYLSAVVSIGGWYVVRSASGLPWCAMPARYRSGAPHDWDNSIALDCDSGAPLPCAFLSVSADLPRLRFSQRRGLEWLTFGVGQSDVSLAVPRGPPSR